MSTIVSSGQELLALNPNIQVPCIEDEMLAIRPAETMFLTELMSKSKIKLDAYKFKINEQEIDPGIVTVASVDVGAKKITPATGEADYCRVGQTLSGGYGVNCVITDITAGVLTVTNVSGITNSSVLVLGGAGFEELSDRPAAVSRIPEQIENYVETLRDVSGQSTEVEATRYYGGTRQFWNKDLRNWEHKRFIDRELFFGEKQSLTGPKGNPLLKTNGLINSISTNVHEFNGGVVTWDAIQANLVQDVRFMQSTNINMYCSRKGVALIEKIIRDKTIPQSYISAAGIDIKKIGLVGKTLNLIIIDHFEAGSALEGTMILVDPSMIEIVTTANQETGQRNWMLEYTVKRENNPNGTDGTISEVYSAFGLRLHNEKAHAIWWNALTASANSGS